MSYYYVDSSAAVKLYVVESGTNWMQTKILASSPDLVVSSQLLIVELWSALLRRMRDASLPTSDYERVELWFAEHQTDLYRWMPVSKTIIDMACDLIKAHPLKGADAIHLASALLLKQELAILQVQPLIFLSADSRLNMAAIAAGLKVENPTDYA